MRRRRSWDLGGSNGQAADPISQIRALKEIANFQVAEQTGDMIMLEGRFPPELIEQMGAAAVIFGDEAVIRLGLRAEDGAPVTMSMGPADGEPFMTIEHEQHPACR